MVFSLCEEEPAHHLAHRLERSLRLADTTVVDQGKWFHYILHHQQEKEIKVSFQRLGDDGAQQVAAALAHCRNPAVTSLCLLHNSIGDVGAQALAAALVSTPNLATLNLWWNDIKEQGIQAIADALRSNSSSLLWLGLGRNPLLSSGIKILAPSLVSSTIVHLRLECCQIDATGVQALAEAIPCIPSLHVLMLSQNNVGDTGAMALATALETKTTSLQELYLDYCHIGDQGAVALAKALGVNKNTRLDTLTLYSNDNITDTAALAWAETLLHNTVLSILDLKRNPRITGKGKAALARSLRYSPLRLAAFLTETPVLHDTHSLLQAMSYNVTIAHHSLFGVTGFSCEKAIRNEER